MSHDRQLPLDIPLGMTDELRKRLQKKKEELAKVTPIAPDRSTR